MRTSRLPQTRRPLIPRRRRRPQPEARSLGSLELRVLEREPLEARFAEIDLHPSIAAAALGVATIAAAALRAAHALAAPPSARGRARARDAQSRPAFRASPTRTPL